MNVSDKKNHTSGIDLDGNNNDDENGNHQKHAT